MVRIAKGRLLFLKMKRLPLLSRMSHLQACLLDTSASFLLNRVDIKVSAGMAAYLGLGQLGMHGSPKMQGGIYGYLLFIKCDSLSDLHVMLSPRGNPLTPITLYQICIIQVLLSRKT